LPTPIIRVEGIDRFQVSPGLKADRYTISMSVLTFIRKLLFAAGAFAVLAGGPLLFGQKEDAAAKGRDVFDINCAVCHKTDSTDKKIGPGLKGLFKREKMQNGKKPTEENVRALIDAGATPMPPFRDSLSEGDRNNVIAYLKTL
jgi:mono/diheme cytochrome c family protein